MPVVVFVVIASLGALFMVAFLTKISRQSAHTHGRQDIGSTIAIDYGRALGLGAGTAVRSNRAHTRTLRMQAVTPSANVQHRVTTVQAFPRVEAR